MEDKASYSCHVVVGKKAMKLLGSMVSRVSWGYYRVMQTLNIAFYDMYGNKI